MIRLWLVLLTVSSGVMTGMNLGQIGSEVTTAIPAVTTLLGLSALIWKLVTDRRADNDMDDRYDHLVEHYQSEIARKDEDVKSLVREVEHLRSRVRELESRPSGHQSPN